MRLWEDENGQFVEPPEDVQSGDSFFKCDIRRFVSHTKIFEGLTGLKFEKCCLISCDLPDDSKTKDCNTAQIDYEVD